MSFVGLPHLDEAWSTTGAGARLNALEAATPALRDAIEAGAFASLPGHGKPLVLEDLSRVPADLRAGYMLLKSANVLPEEMELKTGIVHQLYLAGEGKQVSAMLPYRKTWRRYPTSPCHQEWGDGCGPDCDG